MFSAPSVTRDFFIQPHLPAPRAVDRKIEAPPATAGEQGNPTNSSQSGGEHPQKLFWETGEVPCPAEL